MTPLRLFTQTMAALTGKSEIFSREFIQWLRTLVDRVNELDREDAAIRQIDADLGSAPSTSGSFIFDDSDITTSNRIVIMQAPGPYPTKGNDADEAEMDAVVASAKAGSGKATVHWSSATPVMGTFLFNYMVN
jgi:uncharacterized iron-regulated membrane protein